MADARSVWPVADAVCFDVDSTVIQEEGIDELAKYCGHGEDIANMTRCAMSGSLDFRQSLAMRLDLIRPSMSQVRDFVREKPARLTPGIKKLVEHLHRRVVDVYLISGGFRGIIGPVALELNIPLQNIYANKLKFYLTGEYAGFDENEPTSKSGGKGEVIRILKKNHGYSNVVMIGDGMTDFEACPPADAFIGYGGNVIREEVKKRCSWYVTDFNELVNAL
ncbi:phosphoserine phosphatase isoform X2 [Nilaparvata lugens]|nr:phosphoserine phosphatase isoform X2 [Nilaparvata lugens]XP_039292420.1 phosphoserine phosphatase isoform X2 [Nilaparvata lugens]XP_039292421.1 phosphoserine phosphatase isoform X2 [Nilaparvata lugens]